MKSLARDGATNDIDHDSIVLMFQQWGGHLLRYKCIPSAAQYSSAYLSVRHSSAPQSLAGAAVAKHDTVQR